MGESSDFQQCMEDKTGLMQERKGKKTFHLKSVQKFLEVIQVVDLFCVFIHHPLL